MLTSGSSSSGWGGLAVGDQLWRSPNLSGLVVTAPLAYVDLKYPAPQPARLYSLTVNLLPISSFTGRSGLSSEL